MDWLIDWLWDFLYAIQKSVCSISDFIREIFYMLGGINTVEIDGAESDLLTYFVLSPAVKNIFLAVVLIGVITVTVFTVIAVIRSEYTNSENKKGKGVILGGAGKSLALFLIIPFVLAAGITLTNITMKSLNTAMNPYTSETGTEPSIGGQLLVTAGSQAYSGEEGEKNQIEQDFITGVKDYRDIEQVKEFYSLKDMDFFVGIVGGVVILVMFAMCAIAFIQRLCITGDSIGGVCNITDYSEVIKQVNQTYLGNRIEIPKKFYNNCVKSDIDLVTAITDSKQGRKFRKLYGGDITGYDSQSNADYALVNILVFWTQDEGQIDRIFRSSGLYRGKWDRSLGNSTYGQVTIQNALRNAHCRNRGFEAEM